MDDAIKRAVVTDAELKEFRDAGVPDAFAKQIITERKSVAFSFYGARKLKDLVANTTLALTKPPRKGDKALPFTVRQVEALLGFQADVAIMVAEQVIARNRDTLGSIKALRARVESMEAAFEAELSQLRPLLSRLREHEEI